MVICVPPGMGEQPRSDQVSADRLIDEERDACDRSKSHHRERLQGQAARGTCRAAQQAVAGEKHCQTEQNQVASNATSPILVMALIRRCRKVARKWRKAFPVD
jgi:hypothetical protein